MVFISLYLSSILSTITFASRDDIYENGFNVHTAIINITYYLDDILYVDYDDGARFGLFSRIAAESGLLYNIPLVDPLCLTSPVINSGRWIGLIDGSACKELSVRFMQANIFKNASAIFIYNLDDTNDPILHSTRPKDDLIYIFLSTHRADQFSQLLDNGTRIFIQIQVGALHPRYYSAINKTSMLFLSISFIVLMIISLAWLIFYYVQRSRYTYAKQRLTKRLTRAAKKAIAKMPLKSVSSIGDFGVGFDVCAVCIEGYKPYDVVRILPCKHVFHKPCIDPWLMEHRNCPICKIDILKVYGLQVKTKACRTLLPAQRRQTSNIEAEATSMSLYGDLIGPTGTDSMNRRRDFDSDGVEIVMFQLAQVEHHCQSSWSSADGSAPISKEGSARSDVSGHVINEDQPLRSGSIDEGVEEQEV